MTKTRFTTLWVLIIGFFSYTGYSQTKSAALTYQKNLNSQYADPYNSPLPKYSLATFKALPFYEWNENYRVIASVKRTPEAPLFVMQTTTDRQPLYQQYAILSFVIDGQHTQLRLYRSQESKYSMEYKDYLFLPFKDSTNDSETYEGGRFLDVFISDIVNDQIVLDFNKAYNPYCAYNHKYSCPVPPVENHLDIAIKAGVKTGIIKK